MATAQGAGPAAPSVSTYSRQPVRDAWECGIRTIADHVVKREQHIGGGRKEPVQAQQYAGGAAPQVRAEPSEPVADESDPVVVGYGVFEQASRGLDRGSSQLDL